MRIALLGSALIILASACGDGGDGVQDAGQDGGGRHDAAVATSGSFSCDLVSGGAHTCADYSWKGGSLTQMQWSMSCMQAGGRPVNACARTGAAGGCKVVNGSGASSITTVIWYYDVDPSVVTTGCMALKGTLVSP